MIVAGTGHRPIDYSRLEQRYLEDIAEMAIAQTEPSKIISGMALGWDTAIANVAIREGIPLVAAIPFEGQESRWMDESKKVYYQILSKASDIVVVSEGGFSRRAMQLRNEWMVDNCDLLIAWYNTSRPRSGTGQCITYANRVGTKYLNFWKEWELLKSIGQLSHK